MSVTRDRSIDVDLLDSPHQNNALADDTSLSFSLPDLTDVLAGFNEAVRGPVLQSPTCQEREFGRSLARYNHEERGRTIPFQVVKNPRKPRVAKGKTTDKDKPAKQARAIKEKVVKPPKVKAAKKVLATITARAIAAFEVPNTPQAPVAAPDPTLMRFLTPTSGSLTSLKMPSTLSALAKGPVSGTVRRGQRFPIKPLVSPRTMRSRFERQELLYLRRSGTDTGDPEPMNPTKLVLYSKCHWQAGNRDLDGNTTDGGPQEVISNQEGQGCGVMDHLVNLTMLPTKRPTEGSAYASNLSDVDYDRSHDILEISDDSDCASGQSSLVATQDYLRNLVADDDYTASTQSEHSELASITPSLPRMESLRESLTNSAGDSLVASSKRSLEDLPIVSRVVSPKISLYTSPREHDCNSENGGILVHVSQTRVVHGESGMLKKSSELDDTIEVSSSATPEAEERAQPQTLSHQNYHSLQSQGRKPSPTSKHHRKSGVTIESHSGDVHMSSYNLIDQDPDQPLEVDPNGRASAAALVPRRPVNDYWVIPDSEDESDSCESQTWTRNNASGSHEDMQLPDFNGYTTVRLQTEVSNFGFKISKSRAGMIALLQRCYEAKRMHAPVDKLQSRAASTKTANVVNVIPVTDLTDVHDSQIFVQTTKKVERKARESASAKAERLALEKRAKMEAKAVLAEEKAAKKLADAEAKRLKKVTDKEEAELAKIESTKSLFVNLTKLLKSDAGRGWWLKILKYEPIVLEDFKEWLRSSENIEADIDVIRDYLDAKGICCVKKITRQGKDRKRF